MRVLGILMNNELVLEKPTMTSAGMSNLLWRKQWVGRVSSGPSIQEERDTIIALQWLVAIGISYLLFSVEGWNLTDPVAGLLMSVCLLFAVVLYRIPDQIFGKPYIQPGLLILDSVLIVSTLIFRQQTPWDLLLLFFSVF